MKNRRGLTLVELVVVLVILSALSVLAITSSAGLTEAARYERTRRRLDELRAAVEGPLNTGAAELLAVPPSFLADCGRLPRRFGDGDEGLLELLERVELEAHDAVPVDGDSDLTLLTGWRGPYLHLGVGETRIEDGWGRPFVLFDARGDLAEPGDEIGRIVSLGSDGALDGPDGPLDGSLYGRDLEVVFVDEFVNRRNGDLVSHVAIERAPAQFAILLRVYGPDPETGMPTTVGRLFRSTEAVADSDEEIDDFVQGARWTSSMTVAGLATGPKWVRAYLYTTAPVPMSLDEIEDDTDLGGPHTSGEDIPEERSLPHRVTLLPGGSELPYLLKFAGAPETGGSGS